MSSAIYLMMTIVAVIGGSGFEKLIKEGVRHRYRYMSSSIDYIRGYIKDLDIIFVPRHGFRHEYPPHKVPYKTIIKALYDADVDRVIGISAVGSLRDDLPPGSIVVPTQLIDYTVRRVTFYEEYPYHIDVTRPYCREMIRIFYRVASKLGIDLYIGAKYVATEGPRFETPSEIRMFRVLGGDIVGMTNIPEAILAREAGMHYMLIALVTNYAAGMQEMVNMDEVYEVSRRREREINKIVIEMIPEVASSKLDMECIRYRDKFREVVR